MKLIIKAMAIFLILILNAVILSYKYSYFSDVVYKTSNITNEKDNLVVMEKKIEVSGLKKSFEVLTTYEGTMTAYGADCYGCSGITASGHDLRNNNIYFEDEKFGTLRVLAADRIIPFGTIVRVTGVKIYEEPFLGIVLDRGYLIKGNLMDLAFGFQDDPDVKSVGRSNVVYEVLRYGW